MFYPGGGSSYGCGTPCTPYYGPVTCGCGGNGSFAIVLVLFILLVIVLGSRFVR